MIFTHYSDVGYNRNVSYICSVEHFYLLRSLIGGFRSASPAWRTWSRTESPGNVLYPFALSGVLHLALLNACSASCPSEGVRLLHTGCKRWKHTRHGFPRQGEEEEVHYFSADLFLFLMHLDFYF